MGPAAPVTETPSVVSSIVQSAMIPPQSDSMNHTPVVALRTLQDLTETTAPAPIPMPVSSTSWISQSCMDSPVPDPATLTPSNTSWMRHSPSAASAPSATHTAGLPPVESWNSQSIADARAPWSASESPLRPKLRIVQPLRVTSE